jgi:hypothetical protein
MINLNTNIINNQFFYMKLFSTLLLTLLLLTASFGSLSASAQPRCKAGWIKGFEGVCLQPLPKTKRAPLVQPKRFKVGVKPSTGRAPYGISCGHRC